MALWRFWTENLKGFSFDFQRQALIGGGEFMLLLYGEITRGHSPDSLPLKHSPL